MKSAPARMSVPLNDSFLVESATGARSGISPLADAIYYLHEQSATRGIGQMRALTAVGRGTLPGVPMEAVEGIAEQDIAETMAEPVG